MIGIPVAVRRKAGVYDPARERKAGAIHQTPGIKTDFAPDTAVASARNGIDDL